MKTLIVNLPKRTDRWETVVPEVQRFGITDFERIEAIKKWKFRGFNLTMHKAVNQDEIFLLLEDDVCFDGTMTDLNTAISELPENWDMLYLGGTLYEPAEYYSKHLSKPYAVHTTHAILYNINCAKWIHANFNPFGKLIYDDWLYKVAHRQLNVFIMNPMIAFQSPSFSDIWKKDANYKIKECSKFLPQ